ncbi:MAG: hypothetical protein WD793_10855 [Steroidobacteraceae bacterium]
MSHPPDRRRSRVTILSKLPTEPDLRLRAGAEIAAAIDAAEVEAAGRSRGLGLHDSESRKRRRLAAELIAELRRPLFDKHGPTDLERIAALQPRAKPVRRGGGR